MKLIYKRYLTNLKKELEKFPEFSKASGEITKHAFNIWKIGQKGRMSESRLKIHDYVNEEDLTTDERDWRVDTWRFWMWNEKISELVLRCRKSYSLYFSYQRFPYSDIEVQATDG